jgi:hypothetical protein
MANRRGKVVPVGPLSGKPGRFGRLRWANLVDVGRSMDQPQVFPAQPGPTSDPRGWSMKWSRLPVLEGAGQPGQPLSRFSHAISAKGLRRDAQAHSPRSRSRSRETDSTIVVAARLGVFAPGWHGELVGGRPVRAWFNGRPADPNDWERAAERVLVAFAVRAPSGQHARAYAALVSARQARERSRPLRRTRGEHRPPRGPLGHRRRRRRPHRIARNSCRQPRAPDDEPPTGLLARGIRAWAQVARRLP